MPNKPLKRMRMSLTAGPPPSEGTTSEPPAACNPSGWDSFSYEVLIEEVHSPGTTGAFVKTERMSPEPSGDGTATTTVKLKVEPVPAAVQSDDEDSDDSFVTLPRAKRRSVRAAESDGEDVKPGQVYDCSRSTSSESGHRVSGPGEEFISLEPPLDGWNVESLGCSARIVKDEYKIVLHNLGCLMLVDDSFVARVRIMDLGQLSRNRSFRQAKIVLLRQLCLVQILVDNVTVERNRCRGDLMKLIQQILDQTAMSRESAANAVQIISIVQKSTDLNPHRRGWFGNHIGM